MALGAESGSGSGSGFNPELKNTLQPLSPRTRTIAAGARRGPHIFFLITCFICILLPYY